MRKWPLLIPNVIAATTLPIIGISSCGSNEEEENLPESIEISCDDEHLSTIDIYYNQVLEFNAKTFPEEASSNVVFDSSDIGIAKFEGNRLIPQGVGIYGVGTTIITAYPEGHPELKGKISNSITVNVIKPDNLTSVDESNVTIIKPMISSIETGTYGISLSNFKVGFLVGKRSPAYNLTASIEWVGERSMDDTAVGIANIKYDSFYNTNFDAICSFKPTTPLELGDVLEFKFNFIASKSGIEHEIKGEKTYKIIYEGDDNLYINDSSVDKEIDFNKDDYKHTTITGFKTNFDFGDQTPFDLTVKSSELFENKYDPVFEIIDKKKEGENWFFNVSIVISPEVVSFEDEDVYFYFYLNNVRIYTTSVYTMKAINTIDWEHGMSSIFEIIKDDKGIPKLILNNFKSNFLFSTYQNDAPQLTVDFIVPDEQLRPISYNINIQNSDTQSFDIEFVFAKELKHFSSATFQLKFSLGGKELLTRVAGFFKYDDDTISFDGSKNVRLSYDDRIQKYFVKLTKFTSNFNIDLTLLSLDNINFDVEIPDPTWEFMSGEDATFSLNFYWTTDFECPEGANGQFDLIYDGKTMINDFDFVLTKPSESDYYNITTMTNYGSMDIIRNTKDEKIEIGIKDIDLTARDLAGCNLRYNGMDVACLCLTYEYNRQPQDTYKMMIYIDPNTTLKLQPTYTIEVEAIFEDKDSIINLTEEGQTTIQGKQWNAFQTSSPVNLTKGRTYHIKADFGSWGLAQTWTDTQKSPLGFYFVCGNNLNDEQTFKLFDGSICCLFETLGTLYTLAPGIPILMLSTTYITWNHTLPTIHMDIVWTPNEDISNVNFALAAVTNQ